MNKDLAKLTDVQKLILEMEQKDQNALKNIKNYSKDELELHFNQINKENCKMMRKIIRLHGLITISKFGEDISFSAWLLIQHFPRTSVKFMEKYLMLMKQSPSEVNQRNIAYLEDKVNVYKCLPQKYGTQGIRKKNSKKWKFKPIENISKVDQLRKSVGLEPLQEYANFIEEYQKVQVILPEGYIYK